MVRILAAALCLAASGLRAEEPDAKTLFARKIFQKMLAAAGFAPEKIPFTVKMDWTDPDRIDFLDKVYGPDVHLRAGIGFIEKFGEDELVLAATFGHEIGHVVQDEGPGGVEELANTHGNKRMEAQADLIGGQIAERAGYSVEQYLAGREKKLTCAKIRSRDDGFNESHPANADKWVNILAYQAAVNALPGFPSIGPDAFTEDGVLRPSALLGALDDAVDAFIEPPGTRKELARLCGDPSSYASAVAGIKERLARAMAGRW